MNEIQERFEKETDNKITIGCKNATMQIWSGLYVNWLESKVNEIAALKAQQDLDEKALRVLAKELIKYDAWSHDNVGKFCIDGYGQDCPHPEGHCVECIIAYAKQEAATKHD
jgi:hypothetical protein